MELHGRIMNIAVDKAKELDALKTANPLAYKLGHRDARHAAAELALKADACIQVLRAIVDEQSAMGFDGSPSDELMDCARSALG